MRFFHPTGCRRQSLQRVIYEADFFRLVKLLQVKPTELERMMLLASQVAHSPLDDEDIETQKAEAIAICKRRIQAAIDLYGDGRISREEYLRRVERNERELASWEARTSESEKLGMELTMCIHAVDTITRL